MFGSDWENLAISGVNFFDNRQKHQSTYFQNITSDQNFAGIIPRTIYQIYRLIHFNQSGNYNIYCSFLQIYNEKIYDLLQVIFYNYFVKLK